MIMKDIINKLNKCKQPIIILLFTAFLILLYWIIIKLIICKLTPYPPCDFMAIPIKGFGSFWPLSHFIVFFILGLFFNKCMKIILILGVIWEFIEFFGGFLEKKKKKIPKLMYSDKWWAPNLLDIIMNFLGFFCGYYFSTIFKVK